MKQMPYQHVQEQNLGMNLTNQREKKAHPLLIESLPTVYQSNDEYSKIICYKVHCKLTCLSPRNSEKKSAAVF